MKQPQLVLIYLFNMNPSISWRLLLVVSCCASLPTTTHAFAPSLQFSTQRLDTPPLPAGSIRKKKKHVHQNTPWSNPNHPSASSLSSFKFRASPSGIDEWPLVAQSGVFVATYVGLAIGTWAGTTLLDGISSKNLEQWRNNVIDTTLPLLLGAFFTLAGTAHFTSAQAFQDIYPPPGTWGFWYLPGSAAFHVAWTGVVEALGGLGLLFSGTTNLLFADDQELELPWSLIQPLSALALLLLTIVVTPANIYMFTHGAVMGDAMGQLDLSFHAIRFGVQVVLLSLLLSLTKDSFFYVWGDQLD